ncbi:Rgp1-domain-containing protein [Athelia psychrophila]|uniref:Rgp1-domain-containing protein n=1 Tax=Athelia psychrophila TaxID=1759441 RepID=A0A166T778_9AGAM|nr:Rgp1-domain-containing protein [Fibularhizoctonia sp. CBS 109695]
MAFAHSSTPAYPTPADADSDSAIRVAITPSQSAYFAGEPFAATITFTNTRSPSYTHIPSSSRAHKRGAHSVSSAPLARPPTSPGTPRTAVPPIPPTPGATAGGVRITRRGLVGNRQPPDDVPDMLEESRKRLLAKARSVSATVPASELPPIPPIYVRAYDDAPPLETLPYARAQAVPAHHPHARKHSSVFDAQIHIPPQPQQPPPRAGAQSPQTTPTSPSTLASASYPPSPSTSVFSLALPPIAEAAAPPPRPRPHADQELILYAYAQLTGSLALATPAPAPAGSHLRAALAGSKRTAAGGGSMDISSSLHARRAPRPHRRSTSFSSSLISLISSPAAPHPHAQLPATAASLTSMSTPSLPLSASQSWPAVLRPRGLSQSLLAFGSGPAPAGSVPPPSANASSSGLGLGLGWWDWDWEEVDPEAPLPTFEVPQVMLAVDLALRPGESRSYTYTLPLPPNLPPTFKGRALRFSYEFVVGTCRAGSGGIGGVGGVGGARNSVSRVMKMPIRMYNHVAVGRMQRPYDLMWPVARRRAGAGGTREGAVVSECTAPKHAPKPYPPASAASSETSTHTGATTAADIPADLREYAQRLLSSFPAAGGQGGVGFGREHDEEREDEEDEENRRGGGLSGCREAVEILTRNPKKASYDVNKDGVKVAELTFVKSAYRLGETVLGVVEVNTRTSRARVLSMSAILETHESLPSSLAPPSAPKLRRVLAEHHASFVLSSLRTTFALDIPSDASPAFDVQNSADTPGGLEWKVRLCLLVAIAAPTAPCGPEGVRVKSMLRDSARGEWGSSWKACAGLAPLERRDPGAGRAAAQTWGQYLTPAFLGGDPAYDEEGDEEGDGLWDGAGTDGAQRDFGGGRGGWVDVRVETVECEVPIKVWPGNTAFKAMEIVFDV